MYFFILGTGSLTTLNVYDDWPDPPNGTDESLSCLTSDTDLDSLTHDGYAVIEQSKRSNVQCGTYVIRRASKRDRIQLAEAKTPTKDLHPSKSPSYCNGETDLKRYMHFTLRTIPTLSWGGGLVGGFGEGKLKYYNFSLFNV